MRETCPSESELAALLDAEATVPEQIETHIAGCSLCQERLDDLSASEGVVSDFVAVIEPPGPDLDSTPELKTAIESARSRGFDFATATIDSEERGPPDLEFLDPPEYAEQLERLANFAIYELIAEGGMGLVFRAHDPELQRDVAIKVLSPQLATDPEAREMFLSEARAAASLDHENILPIHLVETSREIPFLVMPLVRGGTLHDRLRSGEPLHFETEILPIALASARALARAHGAGLIHRDVKPANLMLETGEDGARRIWLADFGLARAAKSTAEKSKIVAGTPHFMAPELLDGAPASEQSDLFALGAVFYAMGAGRLPFSGKNASEVLKSIRETEPKSLAEVNFEIPEWFSELTAQLLAKDSGNRIQSATILVTRLEAHIETRQAAAIRAPLFRRLRRLAVAIFVMAGLLAGAIAALDLSGRTSLVNAYRARSNGEPFGIRGSWGLYPDLAEAVAAAPGGATIEIYHDGRLAVPEVQIRSKTLTIEPARGFLPLLVNEGANTPLIGIEDGDLTLRHLAFQQNISAGLKVWPVIRVRRATLTMEHFSMRRPGAPKARNNPSGIRRPAFVELIDCPEAVFRNGYAQAKLSTFLLVSTESAISERTIRLENCVTIGSQLAIFMGNPAYPAPVELGIKRCTGFHRVPFLVTRNFGPHPVTIEINRSAIEIGEALLWAPTRRQSQLPDLVAIKGEGNVFAVTGPRFINLNPPNRGSATPTPGTPEALTEFRAIWNLPEQFSRQIGELIPLEVLHPLLIGSQSPAAGIEFSESSGLPDPDIGADFTHLGPVGE